MDCFSSDFHINHGNILKYSRRDAFLSAVDKAELDRRGGRWGEREEPWRISQESVDLMNDTIINNTNKVVGRNDLLWFLGDFCFSYDKRNYAAVARRFRDRINCQHINYIFGNHDKQRRVLADLFNECYDLVSIKIGEESVVLCHYALAVWDKRHFGAINLYGHSHSDAEGWLNEIMPGRRSMDVGIDNAAKILGEYRPFSWDEVLTFLPKPDKLYKHHSDQ